MRVDEIQILLDQGRIALNQGRFDEASELIERVLAEDAQNEQALNLRGLLFFKQDRYLEAVELFGGLVSKYPEEPTLLMNLGLAYLKSEQYDAAIKELDKALEKQPNNPKILNYLGLAHSGIGQLKQAQDYFLRGGSTKMADQMLQMMVEKSGEADSDEATVDAEQIEEIDIETDEPVETLDPAPETGTNEPAEEVQDVSIDASFADTFAPAPQAEAPQDDSDHIRHEPQDSSPPLVADEAPENSEVEENDSTTAGATVADGQTAERQPDAGPVPTDILGSAISLLKDRYGMVLETAAAGKNLAELSQLLKLVKEPSSAIDHIRANLIRVGVPQEGIALSRVKGLLALGGDLRAEPRQKRYKGKDIKSGFGGEQNPVYELVGSGSVYLSAAERETFFPLTLEGEMLYVVEDAFFAMAGEWRWENGRLPGKDGQDLHLVQLRGNGTLVVVLGAGEKLSTIELKGDKLTLPVHRLAGWFGNIVPVLVDLPLPNQQSSAGAVQFQGDGTVLLKAPDFT